MIILAILVMLIACPLMTIGIGKLFEPKLTKEEKEFLKNYYDYFNKR